MIFSLKRRITLLIVASLVAVWAVMLYASYRAAHHEVEELSDSRLRASAQALLLLDLEHLKQLSDLGPPAIGIRQHDHDGDNDSANDSEIALQVWDGSGKLLLQTASAPNAAFTPQDGLLEVKADGQDWRTLALWNPTHGFEVRLFELEHARQDIAGNVAERLLKPLLLVLPLLAIAIWISVGRGLAPLRKLSEAIAVRGADNLEPIDAGRVPLEVEPLATSLNALLGRLHDSIDKERRFTADASHELRTPLAAIKTQAEVAAAEDNPEKRRVALVSIVAGVDRASHMVQQLLTLARVDQLSDSERNRVELGGIATQCAARFAEKALAKNINIGVSADTDMFVMGDAAMLDILLENLVDNAIRFTPPAGQIEIVVARDGNGIALSVRDDGPGIPAHSASRVLERFYRVEGTGVPGSGLGLSIVERVASIHRAEIRLSRGIGDKGLGVRVRFPAG